MSYPPEQQPQYPAQPQMPPAVQAQQPGVWQGAPQGAPGQYAAQQPGGYQAAPAAPRPNPFAGTPISDWVRDGAAVLLLLISLALPWRATDYGMIEAAAGRIDVLLITLLSVLSVGIGYLARAGMMGPMPATKVAMFRALANVPYILIVLMYIVFDLLKFSGYTVGAAAAVGLTGALFAALPRKYEVYTPEFGPIAAKYGYFAAIGLLGFAALTTLLGMIFTFIAVGEYMNYGYSPMLLINSIIAILLPLLAAIALAFWVVKRSEIGRVVGVAVGCGAILGAFFAAMTTQGSLQTVHSNYGYSILVLAIGAAVYSTPGLTFAMRNPGPLNTWLGVLKTVPVLLMGVGGWILLSAIMYMIATKGQSVGISIGLLICAILFAGGAAFLRMQVIANLQQNRMMIAGIAGGLTLIGLVALILTGVGLGEGGSTLGMTEIAAYMLAPAALLVYALFAPKEMREFFPAAAPHQAQPQGQYGYAQPGAQPAAQPGYAQAGYAQPAQPGYAQQPAAPAMQAAAPVAPAAPAMNDDAARAANPATPAAELHAMSSRSDLWPYLAANPSLYPELRTWLASTGDPAVLQALQNNPAQG